MVNENAVYTAIKKILDDDATLRSLLGVKQVGSKVFTGPDMPEFVPPAVQVVILTDEMNIVTTEAEITFYVNTYCTDLLQGEIDRAQIENILQRCFTLIHDQSLTVSNHTVFEMFAEGRNSVMRDRDRTGVSFGGIRCRMFAIRTA